MQHDIRVDGLANARDLGGLARTDGSVTPTGVFVRSERLDLVTPAGWESLSEHGVRTVIDLRRPQERTGEVPEGVQRINVDLDGADPRFWAPLEADGRWGTPLYYQSHLAELPHRLTEALQAIASVDEGAILFHCSAGWDRTGLVAAVLLRALDVTADAATADYLSSFSNADAMESLHGRSFEVAERHAILSRFGHTAESAFRETYQELDIEEWFSKAAIDNATRLAVMTWRGSTESRNR